MLDPSNLAWKELSDSIRRIIIRDNLVQLEDEEGNLWNINNENLIIEDKR